MSTFHQLLKQASPETRDGWKKLCSKVNETPILQSLLYDLDLLPEQIANSYDANKLISIVNHFSELERSKGCDPTPLVNQHSDNPAQP